VIVIVTVAWLLAHGHSADATPGIAAGAGAVSTGVVTGLAGAQRTYKACDEDWCRILSVMAHGGLMLAAISGRRGIAAGVELPAAGVQPVQRWRRELVAESGWLPR